MWRHSLYVTECIRYEAVLNPLWLIQFSKRTFNSGFDTFEKGNILQYSTSRLDVWTEVLEIKKSSIKYDIGKK